VSEERNRLPHQDGLLPMKVITTFHSPTSVIASVKCQLSQRNLEHLVIARWHRLDIYSLLPDGLKHITGIDIWGRVLALKTIPIQGSNRSNLLLMLAHPDPELIFLSYEHPAGQQPKLKVDKQISLYEKIPRHAEFFNDVLIHPSGKVAVACCYTAKLKVISLKNGKWDSDFDVSCVLVLSLSVLGNNVMIAYQSSISSHSHSSLRQKIMHWLSFI
jgi:DNA damage-binding protein 1